MKKRYFISCFVMAMVLGLFSIPAIAQINPFAAQLFNNPYIANPASVGVEESLKLDLSHRNQWSNMPGSPMLLRVNADQRFGRVGLAAGIQTNKEGDLKQTAFFGAFAYHIQLDEKNSSLNFGLRVSGENSTFDIDNFVGDPNDPSIVLYNERKMKFDTDFGFAFNSSRFDVEFALHNIARQLDKVDQTYADYSTSYTAAAYHFNWSNWALTSKLAYRGIRNYTDIVDFGLQAATPAEKLRFTGIYHSNQSGTLGISYLHDKKLEVAAFYHTPTAKIDYAANGNFEIGVSYQFRKAKK